MQPSKVFHVVACCVLLNILFKKKKKNYISIYSAIQTSCLINKIIAHQVLSASFFACIDWMSMGLCSYFKFFNLNWDQRGETLRYTM